MTQLIWLYNDVFMIYYLLYKQCYDVSVDLFYDMFVKVVLMYFVWQ